MDSQQQDVQQAAAAAGTSGVTENDGDLDDLLDSALSDFDKNPSLSQVINTNVPLSPATSSKTSSEAGKVSIQMTNLYVDDDLDYEDRPKVQLPKASDASTKKTSAQQQPVPDLSSLLFGGGTGNASTSSGNPNVDENMKMFEEVVILRL
jgi:hypothetical protein